MIRATVPAQRLCLALLLAIGFALPFGILVGWLNETRKELLGMKVPYSNTQVVVATEGEVLIQEMSYDNRAWSYDYRSLDGTPIDGNVDRSRFLSVNQLSLEPQWSGVSTLGLESQVVYAAETGSERWYLVVHRGTMDGLCYFVGFNVSNRMPVGYLGAEGFQTERPAEEEMVPFDGSAATHFGRMPVMYAVGPQNATQPIAMFLLSNGRLLKIDPLRRSVAPAIERDDIVDIAQVQDSSRWSTAEAAGAVIAYPILLRTPESVLRFDPLTDAVQEFPLPEELRSREFLFFPRGDEPAVVVAWSWTVNRAEGTGTKCDVVLIDGQGNVTERFDDVAQRASGRQSRTDEALVVACAVPSPLVSLLTTTMLMPMDQSTRGNYTLADAFADSWPAIVLTCIVGGICVFLTIRRQHARGQPRSMVWCVFVFVLGLPGLVGYLLHRRWPDIEPPQPPEPNGLEVFL